jgi:sterol desaturase/sphingolipid hydroxylase (fatty acid hydroxylase superfamily)
LATRYGYFPLMAFGVNGLAIAVIFSANSPAAAAAQILGLMVLALVLAFSSERLLPYNVEWNAGRGDSGRDIIHFAVNESISLVPLLIIPIFVGVAPEPASSLWPADWPLLLQLMLGLLIFDLAQNLFHLLSHVWEPLWRLHAVHHEVRRMYGFNGIMKHPIYQALSAVVSTGPLVLLGMPKAFSLALVFMSFTQLLLQHSNTDYRLGPFRRVFAVAEVHRFHHLLGRAGDVNFSLFFSFYDHLFGNAYFERRLLESRDIGVAYVAYPVSWWKQMKAPFRDFETTDAQDTSGDPLAVDIPSLRLGGGRQGA